MELGGGGYTDRQTDRSGKERGSLLGSVPAVSHRDQAWGSEILSTGTLLPSGGASGLGRLPGLPREKGAWRAGDPTHQARSQEHSSLASLREARGNGDCLCRRRKVDMEMNCDWLDSRLLGGRTQRFRHLNSHPYSSRSPRRPCVTPGTRVIGVRPFHRPGN